MTDYDELSYLRKLAREQAEKIKHYQTFVCDMDNIGVMLTNPLQKRGDIVNQFLKSKRHLNTSLK